VKDGENENGTADELVEHTHQEQLRIAKAVHNPEKRRWLLVGRVNMYDTPGDFVKVYVLEGTPPRAYIIETWGDVARIENGKVTPVYSVHAAHEKCLCSNLPRKRGK
jgi:hypothetical protein